MSRDELLRTAAIVPFTCGVVVFTVGLARVASAGPAELVAAIGLGLEFLLAAGLLRLSAIDDFGALTMVGAIVLLRRVIGVGFRAGLRALGSANIMRIRA